MVKSRALVSPSKLTIRFCFPDSDAIDSADRLARAIMHDLRQDGSIEWAGYLSDLSLERSIASQLANFHASRYLALTVTQQKAITLVINDALTQAATRLPILRRPVRAFVFPWMPSSKLSIELGGVNAIAVHESVMHIYLDLERYTERSLLETVVHEYTHLAYYQHRPKRKYTLLEHILMEGIAERFREEVVGGEPAPWATALSSRRVVELVRSLASLYASTSKTLANEVLYGSEKYPRWAGYAIGYQLVGSFRKINPSLSWLSIITTAPRLFLTPRHGVKA
jgi:uncharacterized protein YjaZ